MASLREWNDPFCQDLYLDLLTRSSHIFDLRLEYPYCINYQKSLVYANLWLHSTGKCKTNSTGNILIRHGDLDWIRQRYVDKLGWGVIGKMNQLEELTIADKEKIRDSVSRILYDRESLKSQLTNDRLFLCTFIGSHYTRLLYKNLA